MLAAARQFPVRVRRTLQVAVVAMLAACGGVSDPGASLGSIRGVVSDNTGATVANAAVQLSGNSQSSRTTNSGADGSYTFPDVAPGTYALSVAAPTGYEIGTAGSASVVVEGGTQAVPSTLVLNRLAYGSVTGVVTDNTGAKVANATVMLAGNSQPVRTTASDPTGVYTLAGVIPGTYTLLVTPPAAFTTGTSASTSVTVAGDAQSTAAAFVLDPIPPEPAFYSGLRTFLKNITASHQFSGTVLVTRNGQTMLQGAYGFADRDKGIPNTLQSQFRVGSMPKMFTAVAIMQLVQAGKVQLHRPLNTYLPDYPNATMAGQVTIHHLLTHTGGAGDIFGQQFVLNRLQLREIQDYIDLYGTRNLQFTPGSQWAYSNYGFVLLGAVVARVSGMSYDAYVKQNIFDPAGMTSTGSAPEDSLVPGRVVGYTMTLEAGKLVSSAPVLPYRGTPAGGGYSTLEDFARFAAAVREHRLLDPVHTALLIDGKVTVSPGQDYAYGFMDNLVGGRRFVGHNGGSTGMNATLSFEPGGGYVVVVLANFDPPIAQAVESVILNGLPN